MNGKKPYFIWAPDWATLVIENEKTGDTRFATVDELTEIQDGFWTIKASREWMSEEGWIDWSGGECPLKGGDVDAWLRNGKYIHRRSPHFIGGNWQHDGSGFDIVAYRPIPDPI